MNPLLVREVQPPLIYVGGDGRLNNTNQTNQSITLLCSSIFIPYPCIFLSRSSRWRAAIHEALGASESTQGSPQPPHSLTGSLPGVWGFGSSKAPVDCLAYRAVGRVSFDMSCGASPSASRVHVTCSGVNRHQLFHRTYSIFSSCFLYLNLLN